VLALSWCRGTPVGDLLAAGDPERLGVEFGRAHRELHRPVGGAVLCHLDYQPFNVLAEPIHGTVTGIVDWANARHGDHRADLARTAVVLEFGPALVPALAAVMPAFAAGWRVGYGDFPADDQLRPWLAEAARSQLDEWSTRDSCPPAARAAAADLVSRYRS
jgi:aminoglycoside phosphotransferase (APT) family kinase protein